MRTAKGHEPPKAGMSDRQMEAANRARLRRDYRELSPEDRVKQVAELSRQLSRLSARDDS